MAELLIVVLVLGVLATVSVPKMKKVLETRKTTEAENMLTALRTEQEKRCSLGQDYLTDKNQLPVLAQADQSKNYTYQLTSMGANAVSKTGGYTIQMRSYRDGTLCCDDCDGLNKDYPKCPTTPIVDECAPIKTCSGAPQTRSCGCNNAGSQTQTCNTATGEYEWGSCTGAPEICPCVDNPSSMPVVTEACGTNGCGTRTKLYTCDAKLDWVENGWSACDTSACPVSACPGTPRTRSCGCKALGTQTQTCNENTGQWVWGECNEPENCTCNPPRHTGDLSEQYYGGPGLENQVCCEDGEIKTYGSATFSAYDMWCCNPKICCYAGDGTPFCANYPNKKSCEKSQGERFWKQGCFLDGSGGYTPPGSEVETCASKGTYEFFTALGDRSKAPYAKCSDLTVITVPDDCNCTISAQYNRCHRDHLNEGLSPTWCQDEGYYVWGTYTLSPK